MLLNSTTFTTHNTKSIKNQQFVPDSKSNASVDSVRCYLNDIGRIPLLTREQEIELGKQVQQMMSLLQTKEALIKELNREPSLQEWATKAGLKEFEVNQILHFGQRAKQKMVQANLRLAVAIAKKYSRQNMEMLDLIQEANIGLQQAVEKFDPEKGYKFSTYAYWWALQAITRAIATYSRTVRIPVHITEKLNKIKKFQRILSQQLGRIPTIAEVAKATNLTPNQVREYVEQSRQPRSLESLVGKEQDTSLADLIEDKSAYAQTEELVSRSLMQEDIRQLMEELTLQEQEVLSLRFGLEDGIDLSLAEVGRHLDLSRERIRQIERKGLEKLRTKAVVLKDYYQH